MKLFGWFFIPIVEDLSIAIIDFGWFLLNKGQHRISLLSMTIVLFLTSLTTWETTGNLKELYSFNRFSFNKLEKTMRPQCLDSSLFLLMGHWYGRHHLPNKHCRYSLMLLLDFLVRISFSISFLPVLLVWTSWKNLRNVSNLSQFLWYSL